MHILLTESSPDSDIAIIDMTANDGDVIGAFVLAECL